MRIKAETLEPHHIELILPHVQERQQDFAETMRHDPAFVYTMRSAGPCLAFTHDSAVVALWGLIDIPNTGRSVEWCILSRHIRRYFAEVFLMVRKLRVFYPRRRYEAHVQPGWPEARRLVQAAGFQFEGLMKAFEADGTGRELWALVKGEA